MRTYLIVLFADGWCAVRSIANDLVAASSGVCNGAGTLDICANLADDQSRLGLQNFLEGALVAKPDWKIVFSDKMPSRLTPDGKMEGRDYLFDNFLYTVEVNEAMRGNLPRFLRTLVETQESQRAVPA